jgi:hypothetical protein
LYPAAMEKADALIASYRVTRPFPKFVVSPSPTFKALEVDVVPMPTDPDDVKEETETAGEPVKFCARPDVSEVAVPVRPVPGPVIVPVDVSEETEMAGDPVKFCARPDVSKVAVPVRPVPGPLNCVDASTVAAEASVAAMFVIPVPVL